MLRLTYFIYFQQKPIKPFASAPRAMALCHLRDEGLWEALPLPAPIPQMAAPPSSDLGADTKKNLENRLARWREEGREKSEERRVKSYFRSQSRRVYWAAESLHLRIRERRETFGLEGSSQRCTNTVRAVYFLKLNISSASPHRPKVSLLSPHKAEGLSAISASHTYHLCGSARENKSLLYTSHS